MFSPTGYRERKARRFSVERSAADHVHSIASGGRSRRAATKSASWPALSHQHCGGALCSAFGFTENTVRVRQSGHSGEEVRPS